MENIEGIIVNKDGIYQLIQYCAFNIYTAANCLIAQLINSNCLEYKINYATQ